MVKEETKRAEIKRSEDRMTYFERMMKERPRLLKIWEYWWHWYRMRRIYWLTSLWLQEVRSWKRILRRWEEKGQKPDLKKAETIRKNVGGIEDGIAVVVIEERDTEQIARARGWKIRFPRPHKTMVSWITAKRRRLTRIRHWIKEIRKELPALWKKFVYVIYYAYTQPGSERHLEAHLEGQCHIDPNVQAKVKMLANKLLRLWVAKPITTARGVEKPGYSIPFLVPPGIAKAPYEGSFKKGFAEWEWGVQWEHTVEAGEIKPAPPEVETKEEVLLRLEVYDFDYATLRMFNQYRLPPVWWEEPQSELEKRLKVGVYMLRRFVEREEVEE